MNLIITENIPVKLTFLDNFKESIHHLFRRKFVVILVSWLPRLFCLKRHKELALQILKCHNIFETRPRMFPQLENYIYGGDKVATFNQLEKELLNRNKNTSIYLLKKSSLEAARTIREKYKGIGRIGIVNFANRRQPGGVGLAPYGGSQEEFLIRNSNLAWALDPRFSTDVHHKIQKLREKEGYTDRHFMHHIPYYGTVVTKNVSFIDKMTTNEQFDIISAAAPDLRKNSDESKVLSTLSIDDAKKARKQIIECKIKAIFASAAAAGIDHVIFGAFGTGCFLNDVEEVAKITNQVIHTSLYKDKFESITLAVIDDKHETYKKIIQNQKKLELV